METAKKTPIYNLVILDKSGSMESIRTEAINGYNETLGSIKATQLKYLDTQEHFVSLAAFCDCGIDMIYDMTPIKDAEKLTKEKYDPCCCTPLYDAIGKTVKELKRKTVEIEGAAFLVTIITDGYENSSKEWDAKSVGKLIESCKDEGWMFSFIGAGKDVVKVANTISITNTMVWENTSAGTEVMFRTENKARMRFCEDLDMEISMCDVAPSALEKKVLCRKLADRYYEEDKE
ncbi:MAG: VWA domain-containing protein [Bacteroidales bacterium]|nr:VWA domain-containing protein [Bacteroidales bacterium]